MQFQNGHEQFCYENAAYFTAVRGRTPSQRTRVVFPHFDLACAYGLALGDGRTMIYAVTKQGHSAHICNR